MNKKAKQKMARSIQGKGSCHKEDKEVATMLAGTDLVPISPKSVRNLLEGAHSQPEKQDATEATSTTARKSWHPLRKSLLLVYAIAAISYSIHLMPKMKNIPSSLGCWYIGSFALLHYIFPKVYNFSNTLKIKSYDTELYRRKN